MKLIQAYAVGNELFRTHQEALAREREIALRELMNDTQISTKHWEKAMFLANWETEE